MSRQEQLSRLRSSERLLGFPNAIMRAPAVGFAALFLAALSGFLVLIIEYVDAAAFVWLTLACAVGWVVTTAVTYCVAYAGHPRFLARKDVPEYDE